MSEMHQVAVEAAKHMFEENGRIVLPRAAKQTITASLSALDPSTELKRALESLTDLALHLHSLGSEAGDELLKIAAAFAPALAHQRVEDSRRASAAAGERFRDFAGELGGVAPKSDAPAPPGSFRAGSLRRGPTKP